MSSSAGAAVITIPGGVELVLKYVIKRINNSSSCSRAGQRDRQTFRTGKERRKISEEKKETLSWSSEECSHVCKLLYDTHMWDRKLPG